jgi:hypothetical protein
MEKLEINILEIKSNLMDIFKLMQNSTYIYVGIQDKK